LKTKLKKEGNEMVVKKIKDEWFLASIKRDGRPSLAFFGRSKREVVGRLKQKLRQEEGYELPRSV
jgi:hypothetical protein